MADSLVPILLTGQIPEQGGHVIAVPVRFMGGNMRSVPRCDEEDAVVGDVEHVPAKTTDTVSYLCIERAY